jgi:hypothetical protein
MVVSFGVAGAVPFHTAGPGANDGNAAEAGTIAETAELLAFQNRQKRPG